MQVAFAGYRQFGQRCQAVDAGGINAAQNVSKGCGAFLGMGHLQRQGGHPRRLAFSWTSGFERVKKFSHANQRFLRL